MSQCPEMTRMLFHYITKVQVSFTLVNKYYLLHSQRITTSKEYNLYNNLSPLSNNFKRVCVWKR